MVEKSTASLQSLMRFALPLGTTLLSGDLSLDISWVVTVRAQPPAFPDIYGGELALLSMDVLRSYDHMIMPEDVVESLTQVGVHAVALEGEVTQNAIRIAGERGIALLSLPSGISLASVERAANKVILNESAQMTERAIDIQRQLSRLVTENRDLNSLLQIIARATTKLVVVHDDAGVLMEQVYPSVGKRGAMGRSLLQTLPYGAFQKWLDKDTPTTQGAIVESPLGYTAVLKVEKRVAGYLSLVDKPEALDDFDRLVLAYGADVCAIQLAKSRAIASAVEQARGDWVQMWLSGTPSDDDLLATRAQQAGFDPVGAFVTVVFRAISESGQNLPLESLMSLVRDDMTRRQIAGAAGQYVDVIVALYPIDGAQYTARTRAQIEEVRLQLATRTPSGLVAAGISRPCAGLFGLREAYREAKDAVSIAHELGEKENTTFYGDLKLFQLLLALKERSLEHLKRFHQETLGILAEHDTRKQSNLIRTLEGFFDANGNLAKAAQDLDVHRNTLVYRLEKIAELTDLDLDDADNRLILHLALKIERVLATIHG